MTWQINFRPHRNSTRPACRPDSIVRSKEPRNAVHCPITFCMRCRYTAGPVVISIYYGELRTSALDRITSMNENCAAMPPTSNDRESSKSPTGSHSIHDILGIKASQMAASQRRATYSGSDSSSDSSSNSASDPESSPSLPLENSANSQLIEMATTAGGSAPQHQGQGELNSLLEIEFY